MDKVVSANPDSGVLTKIWLSAFFRQVRVPRVGALHPHPQSAPQQRINAARYTNTPATLSQSHGHTLLNLRRFKKKTPQAVCQLNRRGTRLRGRNLKSVGDNGPILIRCGGSLLRIPIAISVKHVSDLGVRVLRSSRGIRTPSLRCPSQVHAAVGRGSMCTNS